MKICFAPNELKTWQNVQNGSFKSVGASQAHSERENLYFCFRSEWAQNLTKTFRTAQLRAIWSITAHSERAQILSEKKQWKFVSLRMSSKLDKTLRTAHLSQFGASQLILSERSLRICYFFAPNEIKTWQNVQNGSVKPFESITSRSEREKN